VSEPLTAEERGAHLEVLRTPPGPDDYCVVCAELWPCRFARATPTPDTRLREALTSWHAADGESWRLVAIDRDGGIIAAGIPEALLDAIIRRATREETT